VAPFFWTWCSKLPQSRECVVSVQDVFPREVPPGRRWEGLAVLRTLEISNLRAKDLPGAPQTQTE